MGRSPKEHQPEINREADHEDEDARNFTSEKDKKKKKKENFTSNKTNMHVTELQTSPAEALWTVQGG